MSDTQHIIQGSTNLSNSISLLKRAAFLYFDILLVLGSLTSSSQNEVQVCDEDNDEFEYFSKSMIAVNKPVDGQSSPESERYTLDQFIDDHIRMGFKIMFKWELNRISSF